MQSDLGGAVDEKGRTVTSPPFFIVGSGRSGTTLLRMILASHSEISIPPETWYLLRIPESLDAKNPLGIAEIETITRIMTNHYRWPDMNYEVGAFFDDAAKLEKPTLRAILDLVYQKHLTRDGKARWGDKTPGYIEILPRLARLYPGAKFIHFVRDGRDVAKSFQAKRWYGDSLHDNAGEWISAMQFADAWARSDLDPQILTVRYEDLVLETERTVKRICAFLDLAFEPQMLAWQERVDALVPARERHIHEKLTKAPSPADAFRWKSEMTGWEVFVAESFMADKLRAQGYELRFDSAAWRPAFALTRACCRYILPVAALPGKAAALLRSRLRGGVQISDRSDVARPR